VSNRSVRDLAASVRQRLLNLAHEQEEDFQVVLTTYAVERFLYRLSRSAYRDQFILKGAMLFRLWAQAPQRPTRDLDLSARGTNATDQLEDIFGEICRVSVEQDGLEFDPETVRTERIAEGQEYQGVRVRLAASLANARIPLQIDVGFGDAVTPEVKEITFSSMLDFPSARLYAYPWETVVAEKVHAMVRLGMPNSRMKDFYDVWILARRSWFEGRTLSRAIEATFRRRQTALPIEPPLALSSEFSEDSQKQAQWQAFVSRGKLDGREAGFEEVISALREFLLPPMTAAAAGNAFEMIWLPPGPWRRA